MESETEGGGGVKQMGKGGWRVKQKEGGCKAEAWRVESEAEGCWEWGKGGGWRVRQGDGE